MGNLGPGLRAMAAMSGGFTTSGAIRTNGSKARVFVVDDEDFIRELYKDMFEAQGHTVFSARSGDEAIKVIRNMQYKPDCIIMDYRMPGMDGIQATKDIMRMALGIPIIFSSADETVRDEALRAGAVSFWTKPFPIGMLISATMDVIKAQRQHQQLGLI